MALTKVTYSMIEGASVNVLDYGADATGVADSSTAIQAALDSISATGGSVYIPEGTYLIATALTPSSNTTIIGCGASSKFKTSSTSNFNIVYLNQVTKVRITGIYFEGNAVGTDPSDPVVGVKAYRSSYCEIDSCYFDKLNCGVYLYDTVITGTNNNSFKIHDNTFLSAYGVTNGGYGILHVRGYENIIHNNMMYGVQFDRHGIYISAGSREVIVDGNLIAISTLAGISVYSGTTAGDEIYDVIISNNRIAGQGTYTVTYAHGISMTGSISNTTISNNIVRNAGYFGINIQAADATHYPTKILVSNNQIYYSQSSAILLDGVINSTVSSNICNNNGSYGTPTGECTVSSTNKVSTNNTFDSNRFESNLRYGINFSATSLGNFVNNTVGTVSRGYVNDTTVNNNFIVQNLQKTQNLTVSAGVLNVDPAKGNLIKVTLDQNTVATVTLYPYSSYPGQVLNFVFTQNGTGGYSVTFTGTFKTAWSDTGNTANKVSSIQFVFDGTYYQQIGAQMAYH